MIYKNSDRNNGNTSRLGYQAQAVDAVWDNSRCLLLWTTWNTQIHSVGEMQIFGAIKRAALRVTTEL
jgi:hypothetical protein